VLEVKDALNLNDDDFLKTYHRKKPGVEDEIIFSCRSGVRAEKGAQAAISLGYQK
jgi:rhodanese-related sulfurtransferase